MAGKPSGRSAACSTALLAAPSYCLYGVQLFLWPLLYVFWKTIPCLQLHLILCMVCNDFLTFSGKQFIVRSSSLLSVWCAMISLRFLENNSLFAAPSYCLYGVQ